MVVILRPEGPAFGWLRGAIAKTTRIMKPIALNSLKAGTIAVALLALAAARVRADVEDTLTNSFKVQPGGQLVVQADCGSIEVTTCRWRGGGH